MLRRPYVLAGRGYVVVDRHAAEGLQHPAHQHLHVAVVTVVVLRDDVAEPGVVLVVRRLPRLLGAQRRIRLGHRSQPLQDEPELDRHWLLAPQRAVVVERGDAVLDRHEVRAIGADALDEVHDGRARRRVVPRREQFVGGHAPRSVARDCGGEMGFDVDVRVVGDVEHDLHDLPAGELESRTGIRAETASPLS